MKKARRSGLFHIGQVLDQTATTQGRGIGTTGASDGHCTTRASWSESTGGSSTESHSGVSATEFGLQASDLILQALNLGHLHSLLHTSLVGIARSTEAVAKVRNPFTAAAATREAAQSAGAEGGIATSASIGTVGAGNRHCAAGVETVEKLVAQTEVAERRSGLEIEGVDGVIH